MLERNFNWSLALTLEPQGTGRREQGPGDGPGGIGGIELATGLAQVLRVAGQRANQHRQGAAHQQRGNAHQRKRQHPDQRPDLLFQPGKRTGRQTHGESRTYAKYGHQHFQPGVQQHRLLHPVGPASKQQTAQRQPGKKCTDPRGDGVHLDAHHQRQLLDPQHLVHQRRSRAGISSAGETTSGAGMADDLLATREGMDLLPCANFDVNTNLVGAGLPAKAVVQSVSISTVKTTSLASQLLQGLCSHFISESARRCLRSCRWRSCGSRRAECWP